MRDRPAASNPPSEIFSRHFLIATSSVCDNAALKCSIDTLDADRIMFSTHDPYEDIELAGRWIDQAPIDPQTKTMICRTTVQTLLRFTPDQD